MAKIGGAFLPLRGTSGHGVAKAFRGREGFKESQALQDKLFGRFKKKIQKTPDKEFHQKGLIEHGATKPIRAKEMKKKIVQQQQDKKNKMQAKGDKWVSPIKLKAGGAALRGLGRAFVKGGKV